MCHNDHEKLLLAEEVIDIFRKGVSDLTPKQVNELRITLIRGSRLKTLIEFSRAVHAEMDALISVARNAIPGLIGSTLYVTTFPCHNCARHIIDAGIHRVVFLEPYSKSLAHRLHGDAINNPLDEPHPDRATFCNYGGIAPRRYSEWFSKNCARKDKEGKLIPMSQFKDTRLPVNPQDIDSLSSQLKIFSEWFERILNTGQKPIRPIA